MIPRKKKGDNQRLTSHQHVETPLGTIEETFIEYTKRKDIAIILINQHVSLCVSCVCTRFFLLIQHGL